MSVLALEQVEVEYERHHDVPLRAVCGVDLEIQAGNIVGLVGETGCGKSSLGRAAVGIVPPSHGRVLFEGREVLPLDHGTRPAWLRRLQMVFQDPGGSLNPRRTVGAQLADAVLHGTPEVQPTDRAKPRELLERVGIDPEATRRYPHEFSGGQRQRLAIARALACSPRCIVADEPISSLDVSAQAEIGGLLVSLVRELEMAMLFISHDLAVVREISDFTAVMYLGKIVETGPTEEIWSRARHPYTQALIKAIPHADQIGVLPAELPGDVPSPVNPPTGCRFHPRCPLAFDRCTRETPGMVRTGGVDVACFAVERGDSVRPPANAVSEVLE